MAARFIRRDDGHFLNKDHTLGILNQMLKMVEAEQLTAYQMQFTIDDNEDLKGLIVMNFGKLWDGFETIHSLNQENGIETRVVDIEDEAEVWAEEDMFEEGNIEDYRNLSKFTDSKMQTGEHAEKQKRERLRRQQNLKAERDAAHEADRKEAETEAAEEARAKEEEERREREWEEKEKQRGEDDKEKKRLKNAKKEAKAKAQAIAEAQAQAAASGDKKELKRLEKERKETEVETARIKQEEKKIKGREDEGEKTQRKAEKKAKKEAKENGFGTKATAAAKPTETAPEGEEEQPKKKKLVKKTAGPAKDTEVDGAVVEPKKKKLVKKTAGPAKDTEVDGAVVEDEAGGNNAEAKSNVDESIKALGEDEDDVAAEGGDDDDSVYASSEVLSSDTDVDLESDKDLESDVESVADSVASTRRVKIGTVVVNQFITEPMNQGFKPTHMGGAVDEIKSDVESDEEDDIFRILRKMRNKTARVMQRQSNLRKDLTGGRALSRSVHFADVEQRVYRTPAEV